MIFLLLRNGHEDATIFAFLVSPPIFFLPFRFFLGLPKFFVTMKIVSLRTAAAAATSCLASKYNVDDIACLF